MLMFILTSLVIGICMIPITVIIGLLVSIDDFRYNPNFPFVENFKQLLKISTNSIIAFAVGLYGVGLIVFFILLSFKLALMLN